MLPCKTDLARHALQAHRTALDMRQRRLLILCDGQRDLAVLTALLGPDTPARVIQLIQAGYLHTAAGAADATADAATMASGTRERRRSLAAARIYLLGILEMQRHPRAAAWFGELQRSRDDALTLGVMQQALQELPALTTPGYSERVRRHLLEVLPHEHCAALSATA